MTTTSLKGALSACSYEIDLQRRTPVEQARIEPLVPRETKVSRNTVRKVLRSGATCFEYARGPAAAEAGALTC